MKLDFRIAVTKLYRVVDEVYDDLHEAIFISKERHKVLFLVLFDDRWLQLYVLRLCEVAYDTESLVNCVKHRELGLVDLECIIFELCQIQQIHHQVIHDLRGIQRNLQSIKAVTNTEMLFRHTDDHLLELLFDRSELGSTHVALMVFAKCRRAP